MQAPDFSNLTLLELLFVLISVPGMGLWAKVVSDQIRNMVRGGDQLSPIGEEIGAWLRLRTPLQMQGLVIGLITLLPAAAYLILASLVDPSLWEIEQFYRFLRDLIYVQLAAAAYYQLVKARIPVDVTPATVMINTGLAAPKVRAR